MFEAHAEKDLAALGRGATDAPRGGEGVDLQLEDSGGESLRRLRREEGVIHTYLENNYKISSTNKIK